MDKQNSINRTLEVVWSRNGNNTFGSKMLPQKKEIYLDDSIIKEKKKFHSERKINENSTHNRVKRCLFQENKNKKVHKRSDLNKVNKKHCKYCLTSNLTKVTDNLLSQIITSKSSQLVSTQEQLNNKNIDLLHNFPSSHQIVDQINPHKSNKSNINLGNVPSCSNTEDLGDLIESSEIICPVNNHKFKKRKVHSKKLKRKNCIKKSDIKKERKLQRNKKRKIINKHSDTIKILNSPTIETILKSNPCNSIISIEESQKYKNGALKKLFKIKDDIPAHNSDTYLIPSLFIPPKNNEDIIKDNLKLHHKSEGLNQNKYINNVLFTHSSEINVIPATPENDGVNVDTFKINYSPGITLNNYVPLIEVDQSPETQQEKNGHICIQSIQSPPKTNCAKLLPGLFEPVISPTQISTNNEVPFKIDFIESPSVCHKDENIFSFEICRKKKLDNNLSPDYFDSAKKRKKVCKDGLRGKFQDFINRKKSEACIREYESNFSKNYQPRQDETALLNIIESWKEFKTFVLLCYYIDSESRCQKVLITLDNCPKNATKSSIIRIHSPWLTIKCVTTDLLLFIGIVNVEVVELSESTNLFGQTKLLKDNQNEVLWKCKCSKESICQCLGELSVYNYLQYIISD